MYNDFYDIEDIFDFYDNETPWAEDVYDEESARALFLSYISEL